MAAWIGCIAGTHTESEFREALTLAGLDEIEIRETHRVPEHAGAAIIRLENRLSARPASSASATVS